MFGDLMGKLEEQQKAIQEQLKEIRVEKESDNKLVYVKLNGLHEVLDLQLRSDGVIDKEMIEDVIVVTLNAAHQEVNEAVSKVTKSSISDLLPPGLGNLFG